MIPTEPIGSVPRPAWQINTVAATGAGDPSLEPLFTKPIRDTIEQFKATGSPVITDGEQRKHHNFWTYCVESMPNTAPDGFQIAFAAGHVRRMPRLTAGPFRYSQTADRFVCEARQLADRPVKQAVISPSALSLMYSPHEIEGYPRDQFLEDLPCEHEQEVRNCLLMGAHNVQFDFTEARPDQFVFVGVIDTIKPRVGTRGEVRDLIHEAAEYVPIHQLSACDDCGFSPFCDGASTSQETAFAEIRARVLGAELAAQRLGV